MTQTTDITRRIALITGGSRGLGRHTAEALAAQGVDVILTYRARADEAQAAVAAFEAQGVRAAALPLDVGASRSFAAFVQQVHAVLAGWGAERIDHLVNNAGMGSYGSFADTTEAQFDALMAVHFKGPFFLTQALLPLINDGGRIINISSGLARFAYPGYAAYASMKGAIEVMTRYLARELGPRGIAVNTVAPGAIATDFGGGTVRDNPQVNAHIAAQTAMGRVGQPDDIGGAIAELLSPAMRWMTGQRIELSGGQSL